MTMNDKIVAALKRAIEVMNDKGKHWTQGTLRDRDYDEPRYCSLGALYYVSNADLDLYYQPGAHMQALESGDVALRRRLVYALAAAVPDDERTHNLDDYAQQEWVITEWNDEPDRSWDEVVELFGRAQMMVEARKGQSP